MSDGRNFVTRIRFPARYTHVSEWASWQANLRATFAGVPLNSLPFLSQSSTMSSAFSRPISFLRLQTPRMKGSCTGHLMSHQNFVSPCLMCTPTKTLVARFSSSLGRAFGNLLTLKLTSSTRREARPGSTLSYRGACLAFI